MKFQFSQHNFEKYSNTNFMKIYSVAASLFHADGWSGIPDKGNGAFCNSANVHEHTITPTSNQSV
jgi:hypothetical protein